MSMQSWSLYNALTRVVSSAGHLRIGPRAPKEMLEGLHALLGAAVLHSLAGVGKGKGTIL